MEGAPFTIGGRDFIVPRLRVAAFERAVLRIQAASTAGTTDADPFGVERLSAVCGAVVDILKENHPELTVDEVKELVHMDELDAVLGGLLAAGGKRRVQPGEVAGP